MQSTKKYRVAVTDSADGMLFEHADFLARASIEAADGLLSQFDKIAARIADNPFQFPIADELDIMGIPPNTYRKCLFGGRYKALFRLEGEYAFIIAVVDSRAENRNALGKD